MTWHTEHAYEQLLYPASYLVMKTAVWGTAHSPYITYGFYHATEQTISLAPFSPRGNASVEERVDITLTSAVPDCFPKLAGAPLQDAPMAVQLQSVVVDSDQMLGIPAVHTCSGNFYVFTR